MHQDFGTALATFMQNEGLTQQEVAKRTGIAQPVIGRLLKTAQPEWPTVCKIAEGLSLDIEVSSDGTTTFTKKDLPMSLEISGQMFTNSRNSPDEPFVVSFGLFDKHSKRHVLASRLSYRQGESEPYEWTFNRYDWIPGYVSDAWLLRYAKAHSKQLLENHPEWQR